MTKKSTLNLSESELNERILLIEDEGDSDSGGDEGDSGGDSDSMDEAPFNDFEPYSGSEQEQQDLDNSGYRDYNESETEGELADILGIYLANAHNEGENIKMTPVIIDVAIKLLDSGDLSDKEVVLLKDVLDGTDDLSAFLTHPIIKAAKEEAWAQIHGDEPVGQVFDESIIYLENNGSKIDSFTTSKKEISNLTMWLVEYMVRSYKNNKTPISSWGKELFIIAMNTKDNLYLDKSVKELIEKNWNYDTGELDLVLNSILNSSKKIASQMSGDKGMTKESIVAEDYDEFGRRLYKDKHDGYFESDQDPDYDRYDSRSDYADEQGEAEAEIRMETEDSLVNTMAKYMKHHMTQGVDLDSWTLEELVDALESDSELDGDQYDYVENYTDSLPELFDKAKIRATGFIPESLVVEGKLQEFSPPGEKYENMIMGMKKKGMPPKIAFAIAWKSYNKDHHKKFKSKPKNESKEKWMQGAVKKPGSLHKELGIEKGKKIPISLLKKKKATLEKKSEGDKKLSSSELKLLQKINFALNAKKINESKVIIPGNIRSGADMAFSQMVNILIDEFKNNDIFPKEIEAEELVSILMDATKHTAKAAFEYLVSNITNEGSLSEELLSLAQKARKTASEQVDKLMSKYRSTNEAKEIKDPSEGNVFREDLPPTWEEAIDGMSSNKIVNSPNELAWGLYNSGYKPRIKKLVSKPKDEGK